MNVSRMDSYRVSSPQMNSYRVSSLRMSTADRPSIPWRPVTT